jgi:2-iminoacetate synthase ThiH
MEKLEVVASFDWLKNEETVGMLGMTTFAVLMSFHLSSPRNG